MAYSNKEARNARDRQRYAAKKGYTSIGNNQPKAKKETHIQFTAGHTLEKFATVHKFLVSQGFTDVQTRTAVDRMAFDCLVTIIGDNFHDCMFDDFFEAHKYLTFVRILKPEMVNRAEGGLVKAMQIRGKFAEDRSDPGYTQAYDQPIERDMTGVNPIAILMGEAMACMSVGDTAGHDEKMKEVKLLQAEMKRDKEDVEPVKPSGSDLMEPGQQAPDQMAGMKDMFNSGSRPEGVE